MAVLHTARLTLSPCRPSDGEDFMALERDAEVMRYLNGGRALDREPSDPQATFLMPRGTESHVWTARRTSSDAFVGWFCLWPESATLAELGYRLRREDWGQGLASEGAAAMVDWGFESAGYDRIVACAMAANRASCRVLEKIGMDHTGTVQVAWAGAIPGGEQGEAWYAVARAQWRGGAPPASGRT